MLIKGHIRTGYIHEAYTTANSRHYNYLKHAIPLLKNNDCVCKSCQIHFRSFWHIYDV